MIFFVETGNNHLMLYSLSAMCRCSLKIAFICIDI